MKIALLLGGPSLKTVDVDRIEADAFVGCNWSFLYSRVEYNVVVDYRVQGRFQSDAVVVDPVTGEKDLAVARYNNFVRDRGGMNFFVDHAQQQTHYLGSVTVPTTYPRWPKYPDLVTDGLYCRNNVGISGLNFACLMIPSKGEIDIYGLDLDVNTPTKRTANWHENHDPSWSADADVAYPNMQREFDEAKKKIPSGIRIVNKNPKSAYRGFDF